MHCEVFQWVSYRIQLRGHSCPEKKNGDGTVFHYSIYANSPGLSGIESPRYGTNLLDYCMGH